MRRQTSWRVRRLLDDRSIQSADWRAHSTVPGDNEARQRIAREQSRSVAQPIRAALSDSGSTGCTLELASVCATLAGAELQLVPPRPPRLVNFPTVLFGDSAPGKLYRHNPAKRRRATKYPRLPRKHQIGPALVCRWKERMEKCVSLSAPLS